MVNVVIHISKSKGLAEMRNKTNKSATMIKILPLDFFGVSHRSLWKLKKRYTRPQTQATKFICLLDHVYQAPFTNMKIERRGWPEIPLILGRSGTQYIAMGIQLISPNCRAHFVEFYCKEWNISDANWLRYLFSPYLIKTWLSIWRQHYANLHILITWISLEQKEIFENSKQHFSSHVGYLFMS